MTLPKLTTVAALGIVSSALACKLLMLTLPRLDQLEQAGWMKRHARDQWMTVDLVHGYIRFLKDEERRNSKSTALAEVQAARAREIQLRTARAEGKLIEVSEALAIVDETIGALKADLLGLPARCTRIVEERQKIEAELDAVFRTTSARFEQRSRELCPGDGAAS